jgi:hypothetical protein
MGVPIRPGAWRPPTSENSSIYHQPSDKTWFLFTNHIGIEIAGESAPTPVFGTIGNFPLRDHGTIVKCLENDDPAVKCGCRRRLQENRRREHPRPADRGGAKMNGIPRCPGQPPSPPARPAANGNWPPPRNGPDVPKSAWFPSPAPAAHQATDLPRGLGTLLKITLMQHNLGHLSRRRFLTGACAIGLGGLANTASTANPHVRAGRSAMPASGSAGWASRISAPSPPTRRWKSSPSAISTISVPARCGRPCRERTRTHARIHRGTTGGPPAGPSHPHALGGPPCRA